MLLKMRLHYLLLYLQALLFLNRAMASEIPPQEIYFEEASQNQSAFLIQFAMDSNAIYGYRTVSDEEAKKVFLITEQNFKKGLIRLMKMNSEIIGFYGLLCEKTDGKEINIFSHCFLKPEFIGKGYGKILFHEAMRAAHEDLGWEGLLWESDPNAAWFYRKMGAKQIGENPCPLNPAYKAPVFIYILKSKEDL